jgi:hypothetical protein
VALAATTVRIEAALIVDWYHGTRFHFHLPNYPEKTIASRWHILRLCRAPSEASPERSSFDLILHHGAAGVKSKGAKGLMAWTSQGFAASYRLVRDRPAETTFPGNAFKMTAAAH